MYLVARVTVGCGVAWRVLGPVAVGTGGTGVGGDAGGGVGLEGGQVGGR